MNVKRRRQRGFFADKIMKTSLFIFPNKDRSYFDIIDEVQKVGFDGIELYRACELLRPDTEAAEKIGEYAASKGVAISCISVGANLWRDNPSEDILLLKRYVDVVKALGTPYLHHTLGSVMRHKDMNLRYRCILSNITKALREICGYAKEKGITVINENQGYITNGVPFFEELLSEIDFDNYGLVADLGNILFTDCRPEAFVGRFAPFIKHVHVKDYLYKSGGGLFPGEEWMMTKEGNYLYDAVIGYGVIDFQKVFRILKSAGYDGYFSMECGRETGLPHNIEKGLRNMKRYYENC
jgi:sugar phosphate isomerase/epimerase